MINLNEEMLKKEISWYIMQCPSGAEESSVNKLKEYLNKKNEPSVLLEYFVPHNKRYQQSRKSSMVNYIFVKLEPNEIIHEAIKRAKSISFMLDKDGFALTTSEEEIKQMNENIKNKIKEKNEALKIGEEIIVNEGPFKSFKGIIKTINEKQKIATVLIQVLGRQTPLELSFTSIQRNI